MAAVKNLVGLRFGRLTVVDRADNSKAGKARWNCRCDCGRLTVATGGNLNSGGSTSCGCLQRAAASAAGKARLDDLSGRRFGRLMVGGMHGYGPDGKPRWSALCDCGKTKVVSAQSLRSGATRSCGCYLSDVSRVTFTKHGLSRTREYIREKSRRRTSKLRSKPIGLLTLRIRDLIRKAIHSRGFRKDTKTFEILGCDIETFKRHIESQFSHDMSWGRISEIHLDHIVPVSKATTLDEVVALNHYTNFQPLWAKDNRQKGAKVLPGI